MASRYLRSLILLGGLSLFGTFAGALSLVFESDGVEAAQPRYTSPDNPWALPTAEEQEAEAATTREQSAYYSGCNAARAAGVAPIYRGQPGYREGMDGDGDGIACEPYRGY